MKILELGNQSPEEAIFNGATDHYLATGKCIATVLLSYNAYSKLIASIGMSTPISDCGFYMNTPSGRVLIEPTPYLPNTFFDENKLESYFQDSDCAYLVEHP